MGKTGLVCGLVIMAFSAKGIAQIDPSIPLRVNPARMPDVAESMKKALEIKRMQLEIEAKQREMERQAKETAARPNTVHLTIRMQS